MAPEDIKNCHPFTQEQYDFIERLKGEEVTIDSAEMFRGCTQDVTNSVNQIKKSEGDKEELDPEDIPVLENMSRARIIPILTLIIDDSRANARDFRMYLEKEMLGISEDEIGSLTILKMIKACWTKVCIDSFQGEGVSNGIGLVNALNQEANIFFSKEREKAMNLALHASIHKAVTKVMGWVRQSVTRNSQTSSADA